MQRIDTHHHVVPPTYAAWLARRGAVAGGHPIPGWSEEAALAAMDARGVRASVLSVSTPGVHLGDDAEARVMAREVNDDAADLVRRRPERFGFFATLTLPDVEGAIAEAARALDELGADGVVVPAHAAGSYIGDPAFDALLAELDRRDAVVFIHPSELPGGQAPGVPPFVADFLLDTVRAALSLALGGALDRHPRVRFILAHGGGFLPYAAARFAPFCGDGDVEAGLARLRRFHVDTALSSSAEALPSLLAFADPTRILFGTDFPFAPEPIIDGFTAGLDAHALPDGLRAAIERENAVALLPRLASGGGKPTPDPAVSAGSRAAWCAGTCTPAVRCRRGSSVPRRSVRRSLRP